MDPIEQERIVKKELCAFIDALQVDDLPLSGDVQRVLHYIHVHLFEESLTMHDVLEQCHVRSHSFNARFKFELSTAGWGQVTIWGYIQQQRVAAAKRLLSHKEIALFLVAVSVGFKHYETFTRVFKRYTDTSPLTFRNQIAASPGQASGASRQGKWSGQPVKHKPGRFL